MQNYKWSVGCTTSACCGTSLGFSVKGLRFRALWHMYQGLVFRV